MAITTSSSINVNALPIIDMITLSSRAVTANPCEET